MTELSAPALLEQYLNLRDEAIRRGVLLSGEASAVPPIIPMESLLDTAIPIIRDTAGKPVVTARVSCVGERQSANWTGLREDMDLIQISYVDLYTYENKVLKIEVFAERGYLPVDLQMSAVVRTLKDLIQRMLGRIGYHPAKSDDNRAAGSYHFLEDLSLDYLDQLDRYLRWGAQVGETHLILPQSDKKLIKSSASVILIRKSDWPSEASLGWYEVGNHTVKFLTASKEIRHLPTAAVVYVAEPVEVWMGDKQAALAACQHLETTDGIPVRVLPRPMEADSGVSEGLSQIDLDQWLYVSVLFGQGVPREYQKYRHCVAVANELISHQRTLAGMGPYEITAVDDY